uniref:Intraflagellar transport protein 57 homolog n=1 Tax=Cyprinus carpio carpio TaxID=630221 RepID=A0A8C0YG70_CYPCA
MCLYHFCYYKPHQFYLYSIIAAWLISLCGQPFDTPQEYDDPNATISNILSELVRRYHSNNILTSVFCHVLDQLVEKALKSKGFTWNRVHKLSLPTIYTLLYPSVEVEEECVKVEEEMTELSGSRPVVVLESDVDAAEWNLEVERVLPQLKVTIRTDNKVSNMTGGFILIKCIHQDGIITSLQDAKLNHLREDISKTLEKVSSCEKYLTTQLEHHISEYRQAQAQLNKEKELYQQASGSVTERSRILAEISEDLEKFKQEMEEKGSTPVVKIHQSLTKLKQEIEQMDVRMGVVEHTLLQAKLREKNNMTRDMHATHLLEPNTQTY